ncbi:MAG: hypothetical protein IJ809_03030 [Clostridia bacterium]|nr:hypothetical protein [Clostridia bacterium]
MEEKGSRNTKQFISLKEMKAFYTKELKTKQMWNFVIGIFIYFALLISVKTGALSMQGIIDFALNSSNVDVYTEETDVYEDNDFTENVLEDNTNTSQKSSSRFDVMKQQLALSAVTVISGMAPFIHIPVLVTVVYPITFAMYVASQGMFATILLSVMAFIEIFAMSLIVAIGMYLCKMSTNHFRYNESSSFSFNDVKLQFNEAMKRNEKVEEIKKKMDEKYEKMKKLNEKTNYKLVVMFFLLGTIILEICTIITGV